MATYDFTVRAQDETGAFSDRNFSIQVRNNLVDRLLAIDSANAYASVDGTTWTERTGKGGEWCRNLLGKWIVCTYTYAYSDDAYSNCGRDYRLSEDTINWTENLKFWLSNDAPVYDTDGTTVLEAAGPLYEQYFYPLRDKFSVINGKIITPAVVNNKLMIVYSTDAIKWYAYESTQSSHVSNAMGINEDALFIGGDISYEGKARHGLSNIVLHNGKYTMINNHTCNFYVSDDLIDWEVVTISNKNNMGNMKNNVLRNDTTPSFLYYLRDSFWTLLSVNNVMWMLGQHNYMYAYDTGTSSTANQYTHSYNYVFYTTNLTDINYSSNHVRTNSATIPFANQGTTYWEYFYEYPSNTGTYSSSTLNLEYRNVYYANGVIFAYCGKDIVTTKTLTDNIRQNTGNDTNYSNTITGSCFFEGDIYYVQKGTGTGYGVKKLSIDNSEYRTASDITALSENIIDITSV